MTHPPGTPAPLRMLLDFDGTLVGPNVAIVLVEQFARDGDRVAHEVDEQLHSGQITLRQAWERQASLLPAARIREMTDYVVKNIPLRPGAHELLALLKEEEVPTQIVSGGLDFYIAPILAREGFDIPFLSDTVVAQPDGQLKVLHPHGHATCRLCGICKANAVRQNSSDALRTAFVGDGSTDKFAAEVADVVFARRRLKTYCEENRIPHIPFEEFGPVTFQLRRWLIHGDPIPRRTRLGVSESACPISQSLALAPGSRTAFTGPEVPELGLPIED